MRGNMAARKAWVAMAVIPAAEWAAVPAEEWAVVPAVEWAVVPAVEWAVVPAVAEVEWVGVICNSFKQAGGFRSTVPPL